MTEQEQAWDSSATVAPMLAYARGRVSDRRIRLFACAVARRAWSRLGASDRLAVEWAEGFADGEREGSHSPALDAAGLGEVAWSACNVDAMSAARHVSTLAERLGVSLPAQADVLREIVPNPLLVPSGLFVVVRRAGQVPWLTPTVLAVARVAYEERPGRECGRCQGCGRLEKNGSDHPCPDCRGTGRVADGALDPTNLLVLADALEDAGCDGGELLGHLRSPGIHVRGCWALDLVLGRG